QGVIVRASHVDRNRALDAAGILNITGPVEVLDGSTVNGNVSTGATFTAGELGGGGISQYAGNVLVSNSQVNINWAAGMDSAGIVILTGGLTITDHGHGDGNVNRGPGGGIAANFGGAVLVPHGSTVNGNQAAGLGGGIVNFAGEFGISITDGSQVNDNMLSSAEVGSATLGLTSLGRSYLPAGRGDPLQLPALTQFGAVSNQRAEAIRTGVAAYPAGGTAQLGGGIASALGGPVEIRGGSQVAGNRFVVDPASRLAAVGYGGGLFADLGTVRIED